MDMLHAFLQWWMCSEVHLVERRSGWHWNRGDQLDKLNVPHFRRQLWQ
jgi:hypothetical protein